MLQTIYQSVLGALKQEFNIPVYDSDTTSINKPCIVIALENPLVEQESADFKKYSGTFRLSYLPTAKSSIELYKTSARMDSLFLNGVKLADNKLLLMNKNSDFVNDILEYSFDYQAFEEILEEQEYMEELNLVIGEGDTSNEISIDFSNI